MDREFSPDYVQGFYDTNLDALVNLSDGTPLGIGRSVVVEAHRADDGAMSFTIVFTTTEAPHVAVVGYLLYDDGKLFRGRRLSPTVTEVEAVRNAAREEAIYWIGRDLEHNDSRCIWCGMKRIHVEVLPRCPSNNGDEHTFERKRCDKVMRNGLLCDLEPGHGGSGCYSFLLRRAK